MGVEYLYPTGNQTQNDHIPVGDTSEYLCVDDRGAHDVDATYIKTSWTPADGFWFAYDEFGMSSPILRTGTITKVTYGVTARTLINEPAANITLDIGYSGGPLSSNSPTGQFYTTYVDTEDIRPGYHKVLAAQMPGGVWTFAQTDSIYVSALTEVIPTIETNSMYITKVWAAVHVTRPLWKESLLSQHTFLQDADTALKMYLTDASITHSDVASLVSFLSNVTFETTRRDPELYSKSLFPRVHIYTERARTINEETRTSVQMEGSTTLKVWTLDADPNVSASENAAVTGSVCSAIEQARYVGGERDWNTSYANWDDVSISVSMPQFVVRGNMRGLCSSTITVTWKHRDD